MASPHNLIGLVNQLQNIESTMMAAIMEMLMKVATLTDANVFLLVDAVEGRRFAGKRHLVDAYLAGALAPVGTDVEMELDPSVTALRRRPISGMNYNRNFNGASHANGDRNMKRTMAAAPANRETFNHGSVKRIRPSPQKNPPIPDFLPPIPEPSTTNSNKKTLQDIKMELADKKPFLEISCFNDDEGGTSQPLDISLEEEDGDSDVEEMGEISMSDVDSGDTLLSAEPIVNNQQFVDMFDIQSFLSLNPKSVALQAECDASVVDKTSVTHKLLTSLLYDVAKTASHAITTKDKKSEESKAFFNYVFDNVWATFPFFNELIKAGIRVRDGNKDKNIKYFMRHKLQKWYAAMLDKQQNGVLLQAIMDARKEGDKEDSNDATEKENSP